MVKITCFKCRWSWSLNQSGVNDALESIIHEETHFAIECPRCRRVNKIPRKQLEQARLRRTSAAAE